VNIARRSRPKTGALPTGPALDRYGSVDMARQLWLLRHGDAEPHGARPDFDRHLTDRGRDEAAAAGHALRALEVEFASVLTSPKLRAAETAHLAAGAWGGTVQERQLLASGLTAPDALDLLAEEDADARILLVGHEPDLSRTVGDLTGARIDLKKGGLAVVRAHGASGELMRLLRPSDLKLIAGEARFSERPLRLR